MDNKKQKNAESGKKKIETKEILRGLKFALVSASAGLIELGSKTLLAEVFHVNDTLSYVIALVLSVLWNFTINRKFTFKAANNVPIAMLKVAAFYAVFTPASACLESFLVNDLWAGAAWARTVATIINMLINFVTEFFYQRYFVFRDSIDTNDIAAGDKAREENKCRED